MPHAHVRHTHRAGSVGGLDVALCSSRAAPLGGRSCEKFWTARSTGHGAWERRRWGWETSCRRQSPHASRRCRRHPHLRAPQHLRGAPRWPSNRSGRQSGKMQLRRQPWRVGVFSAREPGAARGGRGLLAEAVDVVGRQCESSGPPRALEKASRRRPPAWRARPPTVRGTGLPTPRRGPRLAEPHFITAYNMHDAECTRW